MDWSTSRNCHGRAVNNPNVVVHVGQTVQVQVLHVDVETQRIGLSIKRTRPDPWSDAEERYQPGQLVTGVVAHLAKFGAFVRLEPGVEGLIHISELAQGTVDNPADVVTEGAKSRGFGAECGTSTAPSWSESEAGAARSGRRGGRASGGDGCSEQQRNRPPSPRKSIRSRMMRTNRPPYWMLRYK